MSRSGYSDDCEGWELIRWRGAVASAIRGKKGQAFLKEMRDALDAIPEKRLIAEELELKGEVCALGAVGRQRGLNLNTLNPRDRNEIADVFGIRLALACEISYQNDEVAWQETPEKRWTRMRAWVVKQLKPASRSTEGAS